MTTIHTLNYYTTNTIITIIILCSLYKIQKTIKMTMMLKVKMIITKNSNNMMEDFPSNRHDLSCIETKTLDVETNRHFIHIPLALLLLTMSNK